MTPEVIHPWHDIYEACPRCGRFVEDDEQVSSKILPTCKPVEPVKPKTILEAAQEIVHGPRRQAYGHPKPNHDRIAAMWNGFLSGRPDRNADLTATEVVLMMLLLKVARLQETPEHTDSWQDLAGYAACGAIIEGIDEP